MKQILSCTFLVLAGLAISAQVGVGINTDQPDPSAILDVVSTDKGFLPPRLSSGERDAIANAAEGLVIFNTDDNCIEVNVSTDPSAPDWTNLCGPAEELPDNAPLRPINTPDGRVWLSSNLGTTATALTIDEISAATQGSLYQWGRNTDGHEDPNSPTIVGPVADEAAAGANFVTVVSSSTNNWLTTLDTTRWNSGDEMNPVKTANDPCPSGYRVPTLSEWEALDTALEASLGSVPTKQDYFNLMHMIDFTFRSRTSGTVGTSTFSPFMTSTSTNTNGTFQAYFIQTGGGGSDNNRGMGTGIAVRCINE